MPKKKVVEPVSEWSRVEDSQALDQPCGKCSEKELYPCVNRKHLCGNCGFSPEEQRQLTKDEVEGKEDS